MNVLFMLLVWMEMARVRGTATATCNRHSSHREIVIYTRTDSSWNLFWNEDICFRRIKRTY